MMNKKVLVTGAAGFIGSHLTEELVKQGHKVRVFVRYNSRSNLGFLDSCGITSEIEIVYGDLKDPDAIRKAVRGQEWVFHLGALIAIPFSYTNPMDFVQTNVGGTANMLSACLENSNLQRLVHTSTSEVYGTSRYLPMDENHPLQSQSPYAASKSGADKLVESYWRSFKLPATTIRPFNTYGPRQSARAVIPTIVCQMLKKIPVKLGNLKPKRDFTFVRDTVAAFIAAASKPKAIGQTLNVGNGKFISIGELVSEIETIIGTKACFKSDNRRMRPKTSEVFSLQANATRMRKLTGWRPEVSLKQGLAETVEWIKQNQHLYREQLYNV
jgi:NAD dependent epimerase/dehydratase